MTHTHHLAIALLLLLLMHSATSAQNCNNNPNEPYNADGVTQAEFAVYELLYDMQYQQPIRFQWLTPQETARLHASRNTKRMLTSVSRKGKKNYPRLLKTTHAKMEALGIDWDDYSIKNGIAIPDTSHEGAPLYTIEASVVSDDNLITIIIHDAWFIEGRCCAFSSIDIIGTRE